MEISDAWLQVISLFFANFAIILWFRAESRSDWRHMDNKLETFKTEIRSDMHSFREQWMQETKEFHARLCAIEERRGKEKS